MLTTSRPTGRWSSTIVRVALAAIWAWAGIAKIADPNGALRAVRAYRALPELLVRPVAWGLPFVELALALLLLTGIANRTAASIGAGLLVIFMIGIGQAWVRNLQISCGCFGGGGPAHADAASYAKEIARDFLFLTLNAWLIWRPASRLVIPSEL
jgi:uncharacterized membrane protein YphA (DoxX/SURF4 family)